MNIENRFSIQANWYQLLMQLIFVIVIISIMSIQLSFFRSFTVASEIMDPPPLAGPQDGQGNG